MKRTELSPSKEEFRELLKVQPKLYSPPRLERKDQDKLCYIVFPISPLKYTSVQAQNCLNWLHSFSSPLWKFVDVGKIKRKKGV